MKTKQTIALLLALLAMHLGAGAQDTSVVFGTKLFIEGVAARGGTEIVYQWQRNGKDIADATKVDLTTDSTLAPGMYTYVRKAKCDECERWQFSNPHTVEVICPTAVQPTTITGSGAVVTQCAGSSYGYTVNAITGYSFKWALPTGWAQTAGDSSNSITVKTGTVAGTISVTPVQTGSGCVGTAQTRNVTTVNAVPKLTLVSGTANQDIATSTTMTPIVYSYTGTGASITGYPASLTTSTANKSVTISGATTATSGAPVYTVITTASGCTSDTTKGTLTVCPGQLYNGSCYQALGGASFINDGYTGYTACPTGYSRVAYNNAAVANLKCPLNGVYAIWKGGNSTTDQSAITTTVVTGAPSWSVTSCAQTPTLSNSSVLLATGIGSATAPLPVINATWGYTVAGVGILCKRN